MKHWMNRLNVPCYRSYRSLNEERDEGGGGCRCADGNGGERKGEEEEEEVAMEEDPLAYPVRTLDEDLLCLGLKTKQKLKREAEDGGRRRCGGGGGGGEVKEKKEEEEKALLGGRSSALSRENTERTGFFSASETR